MTRKDPNLGVNQLPNALSLTRVALSLALIWADPGTTAFAIIYLFCGVTDIVDGWSARRLAATSALGARLDTLGDATFTLVVIGQMLTHIHLPTDLPLAIGVGAVALLRMMNFVATKLRFGEWNVMHTFANKAAGVVVFVAIPLWLWAASTVDARAWIAGITIAATALASLEESLIIATARAYDVNRRGLWQV